MVEKDLVHEYWWLIGVVFVLLLGLESLFLIFTPACPPFRFVANLCLAITPNLIASLIVLVVGYWVFRRLRRESYIKTMRSIREALQQMPADLRLSDNQAHAFMKGIVPIISSLYFDTDEPEVEKDRKNVNELKPSCTSCTGAHPVECGRCGHCKDLPDAFLHRERAQLTPM